MNNLERMLEKLKTEGGCIVSSADCHQIEISDAQVRGDFVVDGNGFGFIRRLPGWLAKHSRYARNSNEKSCEEIASSKT